MSNKTNPLENFEKELVDYVSNTPNNINPSVVKSMVHVAADDVSKSGAEAETMWIAAIERSSVPITKLPAGLTNIGTHVFHNCFNLALTSLPDGIKSIDESAFHNCWYLPLVSLPAELTTIGLYAFYQCYQLALTSIPAGVTNISSYAFAYCNKLTKLTFEGTPTSIGSTAFWNCSNLKIINVPWAEGEVANAPWGATKATINYNYKGG